LISPGVDLAGDVVGLNGDLPMTVSIDEHRQLNPLRTAKIVESIQGCPDGSAAEEHVVG
jgi:hypothetical protein